MNNHSNERLCPRLKVSTANTSQQNIATSAAAVMSTGSTAAGTSSVAATTSIAAPIVSTATIQHNQQNFCGPNGQQQLPQLNPGIKLEELQNQINLLQLQLLTAQKVLSVVLNGNSTSPSVVPHSFNMASSAAGTSDANIGSSASANVDCADRRTPFSCVRCHASQPPKSLKPNCSPFYTPFLSLFVKFHSRLL